MMKMSQNFANALMDALATLAVCANGRLPESQEEIEATQRYAQDAFLKLCDEWEEVMGEEWEVVVDDDAIAQAIHDLYAESLCEEAFEEAFGGWLEGEELPF